VRLALRLGAESQRNQVRYYLLPARETAKLETCDSDAYDNEGENLLDRAKFTFFNSRFVNDTRRGCFTSRARALNSLIDSLSVVADDASDQIDSRLNVRREETLPVINPLRHSRTNMAFFGARKERRACICDGALIYYTVLLCALLHLLHSYIMVPLLSCRRSSALILCGNPSSFSFPISSLLLSFFSSRLATRLSSARVLAFVYHL